MINRPLFAITDGTTRVNLLSSKGGSGINACGYEPGRPLFKDDGVWANSSVSNGRQLQMRKWTNAIDVLTLVISGGNMDGVIEDARNLTALLEKAVAYWTTEWQNEPVYIERRGAKETNTSYSLIHGYRWANDKNPFNPPFNFPSKPYAMDEVELAIEHGFWLSNPPGEDECVEISNLMLAGSVTVNGKEPTQRTDDAAVSYNIVPLMDTATTLFIVGKDSLDIEYESMVRFRNVTIPAGSTIESAYVLLTAERTRTSGTFYADITGELNANPSAFSDYADYTSRVETTNSVSWIQYPIVASNEYKTDDISSIIQEIVDLGAWNSGQDIVLFFKPSSVSTNQYREYSSYDSVNYDPPELVVKYSVDGYYGRDATCEAEVYVANKDNTASLTHVYYYDDSAASFSSNRLDEALPYDLFPTPVSAGDLLYIGSTDGPFSNYVVDITNSDSSLVYIPYYYDGAAWDFVPTGRIDSGAATFSADGVGTYTFPHPLDSDWSKTTINGVEAYWLRFVVTTGVAASPQQQNRDIYTVISSDAEIDSDQIGGDITALARINIRLTEISSRGSPEKIIISLRSDDRGTNFRQFINTGGQNNDDISISNDGATTSDEDDMDSPCGSVIRNTWVGTEVATKQFTITLDSTLAKEYYGRYRAFMRAKCDDTLSDDDIQSYLRISMGSYRETKPVNIIDTGDDWYYFDYGIVTIPPAILPEIYDGDVDIEVYSINNYGATEFDWIDLVLVPIDEYAVEVRHSEDGLSTLYLNLTSIDSTSYIGKSNVFSVLRYTSDYKVHDIPTVIASGPVQLQANANQRLFFFVPEDSKYAFLGQIQVWKNERYLTFRGDE